MIATPLPTDELAQRADLIIEGRTIQRSSGKATLVITRLLKGHPYCVRQGLLCWLGLRRIILVGYRSQPPNPTLGEWWNEGAFVPGKRVRAYLSWNDRDRLYEAVWWNGTEAIEPHS